jgi:hypothetical protein
MEASAIAAAAFALLVMLSLFANQQFAAFARLPIHWGLTGKANSYAPRWFALSLTPLLAGPTLLLVALLANNMPQGRKTLLLVSSLFVVLHCFHLLLIQITLPPPPTRDAPE